MLNGLVAKWIEERIANEPEYRKQWEERQRRLESLSLSPLDDEDEP